MDAPSTFETIIATTRFSEKSVWRKRTITFLCQWLVLGIAIEIIVIPTVLVQLLTSDRYPTFLLFLPMIYALLPAPILALAWSILALLGRFFPNFRYWTFPTEREISPPQRVDLLVKQRALVDAKDIPTLDRLIVMREIDERVGRLRSRTAFILTAIALALVAAAIVVLFAGRLTSIDAEAVSSIDRGKTELADATRNLARLYRYQSLYQQLEAMTKQSELSSPNTDLDRRIADKRKEIDALGGFREVAPSDARSTIAMISIQENVVTSLRDLVDQAMKKEILADHGYGDWRYIVATAITRVGVVLIIVFLVQILMGLYRYNTRLIAHYNSRRDFLTLWDGKQNTLTSLHRVLAPPQIDFGKEPKHPLEDIIQAAGAKLHHDVATTTTARKT